jgi:23S rRNA-/tRNA-specific pseudouridylate synthase
VGDATYGGEPLWLSELKQGYRRGRGRAEQPLIGRVALHAAGLALEHPVTRQPVKIESPLPKDLRVALKYLERFATVQLSNAPSRTT